MPITVCWSLHNGFDQESKAREKILVTEKDLQVEWSTGRRRKTVEIKLGGDNWVFSSRLVHFLIFFNHTRANLIQP
jgi:hypothetical protein